jgi:hypothetical protein
MCQPDFDEIAAFVDKQIKERMTDMTLTTYVLYVMLVISDMDRWPT